MDAGGRVDVVVKPHVHVDREGLAAVWDEFPALDLGQDTGDTLRVIVVCVASVRRGSRALKVTSNRATSRR